MLPKSVTHTHTHSPLLSTCPSIFNLQPPCQHTLQSLISFCSTLTAVDLIRAVPAVVIGVTAPGVRDAALVGAGELIGRARSRHPGGTVRLVAVVEAVVVAVAAPP